MSRFEIGEAKLDGRFGAVDVNQVEPFELLGLALGLAGGGGVGAILGDEGFELPPLGERRGVDALVVRAPLFDIRQIGLDVAGIHRELAAGELERVRAGLLEKLAVVRNDQEAAVEIAQKPLEQHLRAQVEEVRRLVENQQIRIVQQQRGELGARLPTAGEFADRAIEHGVGELELPGDFAAAPVGLAAVAHQEFANGFAGLERIVLPQVADAQLAAADDFAGVEFFVAQQDAAERRFAGPVAADQADFLVIGQGAAGTVEQVLIAVALMGIDKLENDWHVSGQSSKFMKDKETGRGETKRRSGRDDSLSLVVCRSPSLLVLTTSMGSNSPADDNRESTSDAKQRPANQSPYRT